MRRGGFLLLTMAIAVACGGVNTSDKRRAAERGAVSPDDEDPATGDDAQDAALEAAPPPEVEADAGAPPPSDAGSDAAPVPPGSFAAGTVLETTADLNLREGPDTTFAVIVVIPMGTKLTVKTTSGADGWVHVDYDGTVGYASKTYLQPAP